MTSKFSVIMSSLRKSKGGIIDINNKVNTSIHSASLPHISTNCILIDHLIGGTPTASGELLCPGFPKGRIVEVYGGEGSGKTSLCLQAAAMCQKNGGSVLYLDYENAISLPYATALGLDINDEDSFVIWQPQHFEEGAELIKKCVEGGIDLIIVDSVSAMVPQKLLESASDLGQIGILARSMSAFLPKVVKECHKMGTTIVFINQVRNRIKASKYDAGPDEDTSGGKALKYYASLRLKLAARTKLKRQIVNHLTGAKEEQDYATVVRVTGIKNKLAPLQGNKVDVTVRFGMGFDNFQSIIDIAMARNIIKKAGAWMRFEGADGEPVSLQGADKLYTYLKEHPADYQAILGKITEFFEAIDSMAAIRDASDGSEDKDMSVTYVEEKISDDDDLFDDDDLEVDEEGFIDFS